MDSTPWSKLAGKFRDPAPAGANYHPLACHMVDVGAVALALWDRCLPENAKDLLASQLGLGHEECRRWVAFLAALHDLGKASRPFQAKDKNHATRLAATGLTAYPAGPDTAHGRVGAHFIPRYLEAMGVEKRLAATLGTILGGHHGSFPTGSSALTANHLLEDEGHPSAGDWEAARRGLFAEIRDVMELPRNAAGETIVPSQAPDGTAQMFLAGFVSIADWIGSIDDPGFFEYDPQGAGDLAAYFERVRERATRVLTALRWEDYPEPGEPRAFTSLWEWAPNALQATVEKLRQEIPSPSLVVIEAPMGEGKTEAALLLADSFAARGARGLYVALPTQATANQMYQRFAQYLGTRYSDHLAGGEDINLVLAYGGAILKHDLPVLPSNISDDADGAAEGTAGAGEWFLQRKRALLAAYGVGTVDQALMAVLQVKHVFVRLFGLAGKTVILDEVHAYDAYMTGLLGGLLQWLGALGSPVILLSATLPAARRRQLMQAYAKGIDPRAKLVESEAVEYPRVSWLEGTTVRSREIEVSDRIRRTLRVACCPEDPVELARFLQAQLPRDGYAVVICNTVARAQATYLALRRHFPDSELSLFHARFTHERREAIEAECLERFGPTGERKGRHILVATQVVEQSLDLDFDLMVSDFAPIDLLLQRSGRLMRHRRGDRPGPGEPVLFIRTVANDADGPSFEPAFTSVYNEHVLLRTWAALQGRETINIPGDIEALIERVYQTAEGSPSAEIPAERWSSTWRDWERLTGKHSDLARQPMVPEPDFIAEEFLGSFGPSLLEDRQDAEAGRQAKTRYDEIPWLEVVWLPPELAALESTDPRQPTTAVPLMQKSMTLRGAWVQALMGGMTPRTSVWRGRPDAWRRHPTLRHAVLVVAHDDEVVSIAGLPPLRKSATLGIVVGDLK